MSKLLIQGPSRLKGEVRVHGAKNSTLPLMAASLLCDSTCVLHNCPVLSDVQTSEKILQHLGCHTERSGADVAIDPRGVEQSDIPEYLMREMRSSIVFLGAIISRMGRAELSFPGGCELGPRPIDLHLSALRKMGVEIQEDGDALIVRRSGKLTSTNVKTMPYPGFPTDMQPQIAAVLCLAEGTSILNEGVWDNRYRYADEFRRMGANIQVNGKVAVIEGVHALTGAPVCACDLRAGAAMIVAGLAANGITEIDQVYHIERGYEGIVEKLAKLGADIHEEAIPEEDWRSGNSVG